MELKRKHVVGLAAIILGGIAILFGVVYGFINQKIDSTAQAAFAIGLLGIALFGGLEVDLLTRALKSRQARYGAEALVLVVVFVVVVGLVNFIVVFNDRIGPVPIKHRWDLTETQDNTLTPETLKVLSELTEPVKVYAFFTRDAFNLEATKGLLDNYKANGGDNFGFEIVDPDARPTVAREHGYTTDGTLVVERGDQSESVTGATESGLTNAIVRLSNPTKRIIYFLGGHGERSIDDTGENGLSGVKADLDVINYEVRSLTVITETLPSDASAIVIAGPQSPYTEEETKVISDYLANGGKAIIMMDPPALTTAEPGAPDPLADYLSANWGLTLRHDLVIDLSQYVPDIGQLAPATLSYGFSPITRDPQDQRKVAFFPYSRSIAIAEAGSLPPDVTSVSIVQTSRNAWGETNIDSINAGNPALEEGDATSPDGLSVVATAENITTKTRLVVFSSSSFALNVFKQQGGDRFANSTLLLNSIKWVATDDQLIGLTPKETVSRSLNIFTNRDLAIIILLSCLLPPLLVIIGGVSVWWSRRRNA
ncbi:MAG: GldG family protein [Chloroflexi bacterium]|nr:GldG family protein [Chloroflexota bacterium]